MSTWDDPADRSASERDRLFRSDPASRSEAGIRGLPTIPADSPILRRLTSEATTAAQTAGADSALGGLLSRIARGETDLRAALADPAIPTPDRKYTASGLDELVKRLHEEGPR